MAYQLLERRDLMGRGGARKGSGRIAGVISENKRIRFTASISKDHLDWLNKQPLSQGRIIEQLIDEKRKESVD